MHTIRENWKLMFALLLGLSLTTAVGCGSAEKADADKADKAAEAPAADASQEVEEEWVVDPKIGMTKEEIVTMYRGEPDSKQTASDGGEVWSYHMNAGQQWIPWNFGYRPEIDTITFGPDGKVTSFVLGR